MKFESKSNPLGMLQSKSGKSILKHNIKITKHPSYEEAMAMHRDAIMILKAEKEIVPYHIQLVALCKYFSECLGNVSDKYNDLEIQREMIRKRKTAMKHSKYTGEKSADVNSSEQASDDGNEHLMSPMDLKESRFKEENKLFYDIAEHNEWIERLDR